MDRKILAKLIEKIEDKYIGKYRGLVVDNNDPEHLGRLRVKVPSVLGEDVVTGWALPCLPYGGAADQGFFFIPEVNAGVWIEFEAGDLEYPVWVGTYWTKPGGSSEVPKPADSQSPPSRKIIRTLKGHSIELEDKDGQETIIITDKANGNKIEMNSQGITIKSQKIKVGENAGESLVLGESLKNALSQWFNTSFLIHTHIGNLGVPTSPPTPPPLDFLINLAFSKQHKVE
jgi:uncharacterized protein involved in type VI secretion and phage assembly